MANLQGNIETIETIETIGNVRLDYRFYTQVDTYSDGDIEDTLLEIVQNNSDFDNVLAEHQEWPILAHLSAERENITGVMNISKTDTVLEIGAGCGAVTSALIRSAKAVDCVELSKKRSTINAYKNRDYNNINIFVGNFEDVQFDKKYDVVTLIGVFEYSAFYISGENCFDNFLLNIKKLLNPNGRLYIAIENKLGLKYFAGCREDHTQNYFDSIENYTSGTSIRTFSKNELENMFDRNGFNHIRFFYPYPDYKLPQIIFSDDYLPTESTLNSCTPTYDMDRIIFFNEGQAFNSIIKAGLFPHFSNSFLVEVAV